VDVVSSGVEQVRGLQLTGDRQQIREQTAEAAFALLAEVLADEQS
jgi:nicotinamide mononucleotide (NMN) deamidase PncC